MGAKNPLTIEVTRGALVESRHRGHAVVMDADGKVLHAWGDARKVIYPRSSIKPLQALVLIETGAADGYGLTGRELARAAASPGGGAPGISTTPTASPLGSPVPIGTAASPPSLIQT